MARSKKSEILEALAEIRARLDDLAGRVQKLEGAEDYGKLPAVAPEAAAVQPPAVVTSAAPAAGETISEEELLAISAVIAAYLGERVRIRQVRLLSSPAWAQQGRVSIQASHRLH